VCWLLTGAVSAPAAAGARSAVTTVQWGKAEKVPGLAKLTRAGTPTSPRCRVGRSTTAPRAATTPTAAWLTGPVEHIGSTAIPGLRAKPVIDLLAPVGTLAEARAAVPVLADAGWLFWPEDPCGSYRLWLLRPRPEARTHHLQVVEGEHPHARALLAFRDVLRADAGLRREYASLKEQLAAQHPDSRNAYTNAKGAFIKRALTQAGIEPPRRELLPE
jgi:GrpB-like predicted nucleotidyltransferase (UPF0157 family)